MSNRPLEFRHRVSTKDIISHQISKYQAAKFLPRDIIFYVEKFFNIRHGICKLIFSHTSYAPLK